ncbi:MAG: glycoside hydrolase family 13 protein [Clostridia bacterium]|nr:glycoside hydrolase family 13 protein [Clostridia bacterium]
MNIHNDGGSFSKAFDMKKTAVDGDYEIYTCRFCLEDADLYFYYFHISTAESDFDLYKEGYANTNISVGDKWQLTVYKQGYDTPRSFKGKVMYQIFPDRFYRESVTDCSGKLEPYWVHSDTKELPHYLPDEKGEILNNDFFGGNLRGIISKLDYLKSMGVSVIYLNPIFKAYSNHRYDTCDYKTIDPMLGCEQDFVQLCSEAHKRDIKIILDGVFSHTGSNSVYFDKNHIFGNGAVSNPDSPYRSWYRFEKYPDKYESWWGIDTLPCVDELSPDYMDFIINGRDSVVKHWLRLGADGYRLDVADELPDEFIKKLHDTVHEVKKDAIVIGEVWEDASNKIAYSMRRRYFSDTELDSVMNYPFMNSIISFVMGNMSCADFEKSIMTIVENYPKPVVDCLMNSLSTHDTARIFTVLSGADMSLPKEAKAAYVLSGQQHAVATSRLMLAVFLQFILPGNPCIYYGDEIAMEGFGDPFNRGYFKWENQGCGISHYFAHMAKLKNSLTPLQTGDISFACLGETGVMMITRTLGDSSVTAVINRGDEVHTILGKVNCLVAHNATVTDDCVLVHKDGFVMI